MENLTRSGTAYQVYPQPQSIADPLLLIHGVGLNQRVWQPQIEYFQTKFSVIVYDLLGHGRSPLPPPDPAIQDYTAQLLQLLDDLEIERVHLVGHSMGAMLATGFALAHPQRVTSLTALNMVYQRNETQRQQVMQRARSMLEQGRIDGIDSALQRWFPEQDIRPGQTPAADAVRGWLEQADPTGFGRSYRLFAESDQAFCGQLERLQIPALFLTADSDPNSTPLMSQSLADACPRGQAMIIDNEAHMMAYRSPQRVNPIIAQFIENTAQPDTKSP